MDANERDRLLAERRKAMMENDFDPKHRPEATPDPEHRVATALEYIAYQLGQMNRNLGKVVTLLDERNAKGD